MVRTPKRLKSKRFYLGVRQKFVSEIQTNGPNRTIFVRFYTKVYLKAQTKRIERLGMGEHFVRISALSGRQSQFKTLSIRTAQLSETRMKVKFMYIYIFVSLDCFIKNYNSIFPK